MRQHEGEDLEIILANSNIHLLLCEGLHDMKSENGEQDSNFACRVKFNFLPVTARKQHGGTESNLHIDFPLNYFECKIVEVR